MMAVQVFRPKESENLAVKAKRTNIKNDFAISESNSKRLEIYANRASYGISRILFDFLQQ